MVIIGTIARSWNSRIEEAFSPKGELIRPELLRLGSTCAVEESASGRPRTSAACQLNPRVTRISAVRISPVTTTCASPSPKIALRKAQNRRGSSEERRAGKGGDSTWRAWWAAVHKKKQKRRKT